VTPYEDPPVNPYDPASNDPESQTRPMDQIIRDAIRAETLKLRVCIPAQITSVKGNQKVDVQPLLQVRYIDQDAGQNMPAVQNVPVSMPMGQNYSIKLPVAEGDTGYLIVSDRSLDAWLSGSGGIVDPQDARQHDLSDSIFVPGLVPFSSQTEDDTTDMVLTNGSAQFAIQSSGKYKISNGSQELIDLMDQLLDTLINNTFTLTLLGPQPFIASTVVLLQTIKTKLDTLKGS
jgi:hypothetical protein